MDKSKRLINGSRRAGIFILSLTLGCSLLHGSSVFAYQQADSGSEAEQTTVSHVVASRGGMPVVGKVKPLIVKVAFPDYPFEGETPEESVYSDEKLLRLFCGESEDSQTEKGDTLRSYYKTSSYGQLDIQCEEIYEYTAIHEREFYSGDGQNAGTYHIPYAGQDSDSNNISSDEQDKNYISASVELPDRDSSDILGDVPYSDTNPVQRDSQEAVQYLNSMDDLDYEVRPEYQLLDEMLEALDEEIDYRDYDSDGDGYIDAIYLNFAGPSGEWGGTWWPHVDVRKNSGKFDGVQYRAYAFIHNHGDEEYYEKQDLLVLIHETGHLLGLPDYYSYTGNNNNMLGTFDIMTSVEEGDHNGFSKWTYGWLGDDEIEYVDRDSGEMTVHLSSLDGDEKDGKMVAVIAPENAAANGIYSQYFLVEYDAGTNLNKETFANYSLTPGFRIFVVDAVLDEDTGNNYQRNNNYDSAYRLIYDVRQTDFYGVNDTLFREGDRFAPDTTPASRFYFNGSKIGTFTGIVLSDFVTGEDPSFKVSFIEEEEDAYKVEFTGDTHDLSNTLSMKLYSSRPLDIADYEKLNEAFLLDEEGNHYAVSIIEDAEESNAYWFLYYHADALLKPNTSYTLVIPENIFKVTENQNLEEVRIPVTTGDFEEEELLHQSSVIRWHEFTSNWVRTGENTIACLMGDVFYEDRTFDVTLKKADIDGNETEISGIRLPIVANSDEYSEGYLYTEAKLFDFEDGTMALELYYLDRLTYYHLDGDGNLIGEPQVAPVAVYDNIFTTGKYIKGTFYDRWSDNTQFFSIDFVNPPVWTESSVYIHGICGMEQGEYAMMVWAEDHYAVQIYNGEDEMVKDIPIGDIIYALTYADQAFYYLDTNIFLGKMDLEGNILKEVNIQEIAKPLLTIWDNRFYDIQMSDGRLMVSGTIESGYDKIRYSYFFDDEMNFLGHRDFYSYDEYVLLLKDGVIDVKKAFDLESAGEYFWFYRLFYKENGKKEQEPTKKPSPSGEQGKTGDTKQNVSSDKNDNAGKTSVDSDKEVAAASPKTGDEWPAALVLLMGGCVAVLVSVRHKKTI